MPKARPDEKPPHSQALVTRGGVMSAEQIDLLKRTICAGATDDELQLFLMQCQRTGLDPFSRQIHAVKRYNAREKRDVMTIQVGIDGFRLIADRTSQTDGQDGPFWCGPDGVWRDVWLEEAPPVAAKVVVYRKGQGRGYAGVALWAEYRQEYYEKSSGGWKLTPFWSRMPAGQLAKCAETLALRKAFPAELSGLYAPEEIKEEAKDEDPPEQKAPAAAPPQKQQPQAKQSDFVLGLFAHDAAMREQGVCGEGDFVKAVAAAGKKAGFPARFDEWDEDQIKQTRDFAKEWEARKRKQAATSVCA